MAELDTKKEPAEIIDNTTEEAEESQTDSTENPEETPDPNLPVNTQTETAAADQEQADVDEELVQEACDKITSIFSTHIETAIKEVGDYLIQRFFEGDHEKARAKNKISNTSKGGSLNQVFIHFQESGTEKPSKSWLYQAIDYVIQEKDMEKELEGDENVALRDKYDKLLMSHKVALLSVRDIQTKIKLLGFIDTHTITVKELKAKINENKTGRKRNPSLLEIVNNPAKHNKHWTDKCNEEVLKGLPTEDLIKANDKAEKRKKECEESLKELRANIKRYKELEEILPDIIATREEPQTEQSNNKSE